MNFVNFFDLVVLVLLVGYRENKIGFGVMFFGWVFMDGVLFKVVERFNEGLLVNLFKLDFLIDLNEFVFVVVGVYFIGMLFYYQLLLCGVCLLVEICMVKEYEFYVFVNMMFLKLGLKYVGLDKGSVLILEIYVMFEVVFGLFIVEVLLFFVIGIVKLESGEWVNGFVVELCVFIGVDDIIYFGGWCVYIDVNIE